VTGHVLSQATNALGALADALAALSEDVLKRMSADQRRDFRDVCVELRTGGMGRDLAQVMFAECSLNVHRTFTECSLNVHRMCTEYSQNVH
jgi:hypothetical protein